MKLGTRKLALVVASFGVVAFTFAFQAQAQFSAPPCSPPNCSPAVIQNILISGAAQNASINILGDEKIGATFQAGAGAPVLSAAGSNLYYGNVSNASTLGALMLLQVGATDRFRVDLQGDLTPAGAIYAPIGAAGVPAYTFNGDTNTGIYSPLADQVAVSTGGAQRLLINGAGTTIVTGQLLVPPGTVLAPGISYNADTNTGIARTAADTLNLVTNGVSRLQIDPSGAVTIPGTLAVTGTFSAASFSGDGSGLTNLNASNIASGTIAAARLPANVAFTDANQTFSGVNTFSSASNSFTGSGAGLTALNASNLASGTVADARLSGTYSGALTFSNAANAFTGVGTNLTALNGTNITSGTVADTRLSANIPLKNAANTFTGNNVLSGGTTFGSASRVNAAGQNLDYGLISSSSTGGNFLLFEKGAGVPKFTVDYNGNTTVGGNLIVTGTITGPITEADTLQTVTNRGAATTNTIAVGPGATQFASTGINARATNFGLYGVATDPAAGIGAYGNGAAAGVRGDSGSTGLGVYGFGGTGVYGQSTTANSYGGYFLDNASGGTGLYALGPTALNAVGMSLFGGAGVDLGANQNLLYGVIRNVTGANANMLKLEYPAGTNMFSVDISGQVTAAAQFRSVSSSGFEGFVSTDGGTNFLNMNEAQMQLVHFGVSEWLLDSSGRSWQTGMANLNGGATVGPSAYLTFTPTTLASLPAPTSGAMYYDSGTNKFMCYAAGVWSTCSGTGVSGTANYVSKFATATTLGNSLIQDNGTSVAIANSPAAGSLLTVGPTSQAYGLTVTTNAVGGVGIFGVGTAGTTAIGVYGQGTGSGVVGVGNTASAVGVQGSGQFAGVTGAGTGGASSVGVQGSGPSGVNGYATNVWGYGVMGSAAANSNVYGVYGLSSSNQFTSAAVAGNGTNNAMGGYFQSNTNNVYALMAYNGLGSTAFQAQGSSNFTGPVTMNSTLALSGTLRLASISGAPPGSTGMMYYDSSVGKFKCYEGAAWVNCISAAGVGGSGTANYVPKFATGTTVGNSLMYDNGTGIGIGTTTPAYPLDVNGGANYAARFTNNTAATVYAGYGAYGLYSNSASTANTNNMGIYTTASGGTSANYGVYSFASGNNAYSFYGPSGKAYFGANVGVGTANPLYQLTLGSNTGHNKLALYDDGSGNYSYGMGVVSGIFSFHLGSNLAKYTFYTDQNETTGVFDIYGNGHIGINSNGNTQIYDGSYFGGVDRVAIRAEGVDDVAEFASYGLFLPKTSTSLYIGQTMYMGYFSPLSTAGSGWLCLGSGTSGIVGACGSSSIRYKKDVQDLDMGLETAMKLRPVSFKWKDPSKAGQPEFGFIAEDTEKVDKRLVYYNKDGQVEGVQYPYLSAIMDKAIQELDLKVEGDELKVGARLDDHEARIKTLEQQVQTLESEVKKLEAR